jgi:hypothetical protein
MKANLRSLDTSMFQVSSMLCEMKHDVILKSFKIRNEMGAELINVQDIKGQDVDLGKLLQNFASMISAKYVHVDAEIPTPDNPFVLGYTISQEKPEQQHTNQEAFAKQTETPAYFAPMSCKSTISGPNSMSRGTLNYCMLTNRSFEPPFIGQFGGGNPRSEIELSSQAGQFEKNTFGRAMIRAKPGSADGILVFSQDIFVNHWIGSSVAPRFYLPPGEIAKNVATAIKTTYPNNNWAQSLDFSSHVRPANIQLSRDNTYRISNSLESDLKTICGNAIQGPTEALKLKCTYSLSAHRMTCNC